MEMLIAVWDSVTSKITANCFHKAGFGSSEVIICRESIMYDNVKEDWLGIEETVGQIFSI